MDLPALLGWRPDFALHHAGLDIVRLVCQSAQIVGIDCVELAPYPGQHAADFAVAKLLYKTITYAMRFGRSTADLH